MFNYFRRLVDTLAAAYRFNPHPFHIALRVGVCVIGAVSMILALSFSAPTPSPKTVKVGALTVCLPQGAVEVCF